MFLSLIAFAANSIFCRLALKSELIDATSFTLIRLASGAIVLSLIVFARKSPSNSPLINFSIIRQHLLSSVMLFIYAFCFSLAYIALDTGTGALILFGFVQITIVVSLICQKQSIGTLSLLGLLIAFIGLGYLAYPTLFLPSFSYFILMAASGIAWGIYTLKGKNTQTPLIDTCFNFILSLPLICLVTWYMYPALTFSSTGIMLGVLSGAVTSGLGYALWYIAVRHFTAIQSGVLQLLVPVIATSGGILFIDDPFSLDLMIASALVLFGIYLTLQSKKS